MRYPAEQKEMTHKEIVDTAAREFRSKGLQGIGIAGLMSQAGLTHGGFYAHFKDRDALVAEASRCAAAESLAMLAGAAESAPAGKAVEAMLDAYVSPTHRDDSAQGCVLPALAADIARQPEAVRDVFTEALKQNIGLIAGYMPGRGKKAQMAQAMTLVSTMAGAVLIARAINDAELSDHLLAEVRRLCKRMFGPDAPA